MRGPLASKASEHWTARGGHSYPWAEHHRRAAAAPAAAAFGILLSGSTLSGRDLAEKGPIHALLTCIPELAHSAGPEGRPDGAMRAYEGCIAQTPTVILRNEKITRTAGQLRAAGAAPCAVLRDMGLRQGPAAI